MAKVKILIVENELLISEELQEHLLLSGYNVIDCVTNGADALLSVKANRPDIIIMDIELNGSMDGIQTALKINEYLRVPIIYLTQYYNEKIINRAKKTFPASFLTKPYLEHEIIISIELAIHNFANGQLPHLESNSDSIESFYVLDDRVFIKDSKNYYEKVLIDEIFWIVADNQYSEVCTSTKKYTLSSNLKTSERKFSNQKLVRINKSFIINIEKIDSFFSNEGQFFIKINSTKPNIYTNNIIDSIEIEQNLFQYVFSVGREYKKNLSSFLHIL